MGAAVVSAHDSTYEQHRVLDGGRNERELDRHATRVRDLAEDGAGNLT